MKGTKFIFGALATLALTGCNLDTPDSVLDLDFNVLNHYSPLVEGEDAKITSGNYSLSLNYGERELNLWSTDLGLNDGDNTIKTKPVKFTVSNISVGNLVGETIAFSNVGNASLSTSGNQISDLKGELSTLFYYVNDVAVPGYAYVGVADRMLVMNYNLSDKYLVRTFPGDAFYAGKTVTTDDSGTEFVNERMMYRVMINPASSKCNMIMYRCRFSESMKMELSAIVLEGLTLDVTKTGYIVKGSNIVPKTTDGTVLTPFPGFVFENMTLTTVSDDLTEVKIDYSVKNAMSGGLYTGTFTGSYVVL